MENVKVLIEKKHIESFEKALLSLKVKILQKEEDKKMTSYLWIKIQVEAPHVLFYLGETYQSLKKEKICTK